MSKAKATNAAHAKSKTETKIQADSAVKSKIAKAKQVEDTESEKIKAEAEIQPEDNTELKDERAEKMCASEISDEVLLRVEHLSQYFKLGSEELKAVNDISFDIRRGEVFGLVGESGCGKTTTGRSIIKLYRITSGNVWFKGQRISAGTRSCEDAIRAARAKMKEDIAALRAENASPEQIQARRAEFAAFAKEQKEYAAAAKADDRNVDKRYAQEQCAALDKEYLPKIEAADQAKRAEIEKEYRQKRRIAKRERLVTQIQMIFQDPIASLNPRMTVREIIAEGLIIKGIRDRKYLDEQVFRMLKLVGLVPEHAGRYPHEFSGGQRQRIGVARSVIMRPELIIADEPISALDVSIQAQVINLLNDLRRELNLTILFIAHDLSVVKYFSDRIGVMYYGKLVELATSDELFAHPLHPYTQSLLSAIPLPDPYYEKRRQRILYNPLLAHDYEQDKPIFREVVPGHFVDCNQAEYEAYLSELKTK